MKISTSIITSILVALVGYFPSMVSGQSGLGLMTTSQSLFVSPPAETRNAVGKLSFAEGGFPADSGQLPTLSPRTELPEVFSPTLQRLRFTTFPWKNDIVTTVFWVGERATRNNPVPNTASSWDTKWSKTFGGFDNPKADKRDGWLPKAFVPNQNPFYIALPYNDTANLKTKQSAKEHIPWFEEAFYREGKSVVKGRWIAIRYGDKICYGQWEDCGPFETDDWEYVFGDKQPRTSGNGGAGLDVSPAIRDYLGFKWHVRCDWRFVDLHEIPDGPWKTWGNNNPFALRSKNDSDNFSESITKLHEMREIMRKSSQTPE